MIRIFSKDISHNMAQMKKQHGQLSSEIEEHTKQFDNKFSKMELSANKKSNAIKSQMEHRNRLR